LSPLEAAAEAEAFLKVVRQVAETRCPFEFLPWSSEAISGGNDQLIPGLSGVQALGELPQLL
jgi:hypothetical protein